MPPRPAAHAPRLPPSSVLSLYERRGVAEYEDIAFLALVGSVLYLLSRVKAVVVLLLF